jgi:AcrR family transcriptional regulator
MSRCTVFCMPYPSKTDRQTILSAAVKELVHGGIRDLSLRNIAASLDLAPNAIYRYFSDRRALEAALANEAARQLELALRKAADGCEPVPAIRKMSSAYIKFARDNPHLYEAMMSLHAPGHDATSHLSLWAFTVEQVQRIAGSDRAAQASVALWAFLHGAVALEAAQVLGEIKPASGIEFGFEAWLMAVSKRREPIDALRIKPTTKTANKKASARERSVRRAK